MEEINLMEIAFHWPHDRFAFGWQYIDATEKHDYWTIELFFGIITVTYNNV